MLVSVCKAGVQGHAHRVLPSPPSAAKGGRNHMNGVKYPPPLHCERQVI
jgi:hypothetical protein